MNKDYAEKAAKYSDEIHRNILKTMNEKGLIQRDVAEKMGISKAAFSSLLRSKNMTLKTIANLSEALKTELITFPDFKYGKSFTPPGCVSIDLSTNNYNIG